ncbi:MAG: UDP-N-acetylmuramoyl-L-alanyl-D-glutamate--2,6-diaminopimelate ligase [Planctomycetota bacterium]|nr:UDP-N-acetylmuramoyl-L-alanyl-D-glutamate--2,6-diaminopimelate ligase [Planctomycetota bacterium]
MLLADLVAGLGGVLRRPGSADTRVGGVRIDSRGVVAGDLFCAVSGSREDGARFAADAVRRGAVAVLSDRELEVPAGTALWIHPQARRAAGEAAARVLGNPARGMFVAGVTGTNGKTTTAHLIGHLLKAAGRRPAVLGTAGNRLADGNLVTATHTTPDAPELQRLIARHRDLGGDAIAMEVSSHALDQERTAGLDFDVAIFTNLTRDHLDYHGDLESYARAKQRLFESLRAGSTAVVNADEPASERMSAAARGRNAEVVTYSARLRGDLCASQLRSSLRGTHLILHGMGISRTRLWLPLAGRFNVENALAAAACALVSGASPSSILEGLANAPSAPGRLELVPTNGRGFTVLVDYAHSEDALENVCRTLRQSLAAPDADEPAPATASATNGRLIVVFGAGGDRDKGKRAPMGRVVNDFADLAIVTSDNPRSEDPARILTDIVAGMEPARARRIVESDRRRAIEIACGEARSGDVVLIAGKGHETTQTIGNEVHSFDDRAVAREVLG